MANETQTINRLIISMGGVDYELDGGGGGGQPGPNTVGTEQIIDGAVEMQDLDPNIEAGDDDINSIFNQNQTQEAGAGSGEVEGGGAELPDE